MSFLGCPMRPTSSWVKERSSQYLIYLVIISNSQPHNKFLHLEKNQKNIKYHNKYIYICASSLLPMLYIYGRPCESKLGSCYTFVWLVISLLTSLLLLYILLIHRVFRIYMLDSQGLPYIYSIGKRLEAHRKLQLVYTVKNFIKIANISA